MHAPGRLTTKLLDLIIELFQLLEQRGEILRVRRLEMVILSFQRKSKFTGMQRKSLHYGLLFTSLSHCKPPLFDLRKEHRFPLVKRVAYDGGPLRGQVYPYLVHATRHRTTLHQSIMFEITK